MEVVWAVQWDDKWSGMFMNLKKWLADELNSACLGWKLTLQPGNLHFFCELTLT